MKRFVLLMFVPMFAQAASTIDSTNAHAYGANIGWVNCRGDGANGAVVGEFVCAGYLYSANCGWIHLGNGAPANGIQYQNNSAADYGVNTAQYLANATSCEAKLRGYAYGSNIGWINFESQGDPRVDLTTGQLLGYAYSANCGWIALSGAGVTVSTTSIAAGADTDGDGIPDSWELSRAGSLTAMDGTTDSDKDGVSDKDEYAADTNPFNPGSYLRITALVGPRNVVGTGPYATDVTWDSQPTRWYEILTNTGLSGRWQIGADNISPTGTSTFKQFNDPNLAATPAKRFYRVRAKLPLEP